ncbi:eukaryotic translation initiation factor 4E isoform X3 [Xenopus laevis]|uniref:Eukaryotic translation initiation factor 4E n=1 Tax=Xenopus laevis TaxID=8355 RepID=A0A8J0TKX6_XENLA|nr:eukaryotic translation initiation factor 4E isoform X3 [Xenopus laevis]
MSPFPSLPSHVSALTAFTCLCTHCLHMSPFPSLPSHVSALTAFTCLLSPHCLHMSLHSLPSHVSALTAFTCLLSPHCLHMSPFPSHGVRPCRPHSESDTAHEGTLDNEENTNPQSTEEEKETGQEIENTNPQSTEEEKETGQEIVSPDQYIKHPLQNRWALWFFKNDKSKTWQANLRLISKFDTVEDFWALYNHIQLSSNLMSGCDYSLFKDGIEPMWEDEKNKRGGRWLITLNKQQRRNDLDRFWLETLMCLIGESFDEHSDDVCGAVVNVRAKGDKIAIWTTEFENKDAVTHIGAIWYRHVPKSVTFKGKVDFQTDVE